MENNRHVKKPDEVESKLQAMAKAGSRGVQVIMDFDHTITRYRAADGNRTKSSHGVVEGCGLLPAEYHRRAKETFEKYYPIEVDPKLSEAEKLPFMEEWWNTAHSLLVEYGVNRSQISEMVSGCNLRFREGYEDVVGLLAKHDVPLLVFSAGLQDVVEEVFAQRQKTPHPNMHVVSNKMVFDHAGKCIGFTGENLHTMNKNESAIRGTPYHAQIHERKFVILLGDNVGDANMSKGTDAEVVFRIGFLNDNVEARLEKYMNAFDVVISDDGSMQYLLDILQRILIDEHKH